MDASLGPGSAVRGNGKKRGEIAKKKKKKKKKFGERRHHFPFPDYRSAIFHFTPFPPLRGRVPGYVDVDNVFFGPYPKRRQMV